jgi:hypothetical protein
MLIDVFREVEEVKDILQDIRKYLAIMVMSPRFWEYVPVKTDTPFIIPPGGKQTVLDVKETGKILSIVAVTNNPDVYCEVSFDGKKIGRTPRELYSLGLTECIPGSFWIKKWDDDNKVYVIVYTPPGEPLSYFGHFSFVVYAPKDSSVTVSYILHRYRLKEGVGSE